MPSTAHCHPTTHDLPAHTSRGAVVSSWLSIRTTTGCTEHPFVPPFSQKKRARLVKMGPQIARNSLSHKAPAHLDQPLPTLAKMGEFHQKRSFYQTYAPTLGQVGPTPRQPTYDHPLRLLPCPIRVSSVPVRGHPHGLTWPAAPMS
jgi:hypothetical protein